MAGPPTTKIDLHAAVWTIPATRMKAKREHMVPLCRRAVQLVEAAQALHEGSELVFPSLHGHVIAYRAFYQILQDHWSAAVLARRGLAGRSRSQTGRSGRANRSC